MGYEDFIERLFTSCRYSTYLELGVYRGTTLTKVHKHAALSIGVDIVDYRDDKSTNLFLGTTDNFFTQNSITFDLIFIDADHNYDVVVKDFENSLKILNKNGTIILHDTDPEAVHLLNPGYCHNSYKMNNYLKLHDNISFVTLPMIEAGLTIVKRAKDLRYLEFTT